MSRILVSILATFAIAFSALADSPAPPSQEIARQDAAFFHSTPEALSHTAQSLGLQQTGTARYSYSCCKVCSAGIACGNTCISRNDICHVGPGCACNG